ncbi:MAG: tetratricopeptide repeat protein, partial [Ignavibacteria bacterium]
EWKENDYSGYIPLSRTHRIMSVANGGQVLVSNEVYENVIENISGQISFRDLGERRLKDLIRSEHLFQMMSPDLSAEFPPLKTLDARPNNLPVQLTSFVGREKEMEEIKVYLQKTRLLTLTGSGGTGKTRLALQAGADLIDEFENGVWTAELGAISDPSLIMQEISSIFKLINDGSKEIIETVKDFLRDKKLLLILDNCEHLIEEVARIAENLLQSTSGLKIISTSREALEIGGEISFRIPPMSLPEKHINVTAEKLLKYEAVKLFVDRAKLIKQDFNLTDENAGILSELCFQLDGIPLAIELAASRVNMLTVEKILEKLSSRFSLLTGGKRTSLPRQHTLRALIDWSYDLLFEKEKLLWGRLSVFSGGWTLPSAEEICSDEKLNSNEIFDLLNHLISKSIVTILEEENTIRYYMLETIRQYSIEKMDDKNFFSRKHFEYFLKHSIKGSFSLYGKDQIKGLKVLESEKENFRAAINWAIDNEPEGALNISEGFGKIWEFSGYYEEGMSTYKRILSVNENAPAERKVILCSNLGYCSMLSGDYKNAREYLRTAMEIVKVTGDMEVTSMLYNVMGLLNYYTGNFEEATKYYEKSIKISTEIENDNGMANASINLGAICQATGDFERANSLYKTALSIYKKYENIQSTSRTLINIGTLEYNMGNYQNAISFYKEGIEIIHELQDHEAIAIANLNLGNAYLNLKDFELAENFYNECSRISREYGFRHLITHSEIRMGDIALVKGETNKAGNIYIDCIKTCDKSEELHKLGNCFRGLSKVCLNLEEYEISVKMLALSDSLFKKIGVKLTKAKLQEIDEIKNTFKNKMGQEKFNALWNEGDQMETDDAVIQVRSRLNRDQ